MKLTVNSEVHELPEGSRLLALLEKLELDSKKGLAVAVNQSVIPSAEWRTTRLAEDDSVLIIQATQGG